MPALNFKPQFVERIEIGLRDSDDPRAKTHTIRDPRKDGRDPKPGDTLYLYTGLRRKGARRIGVATCTRVESIVIARYSAMGKPSVCIGPRVDVGEVGIKDVIDSPGAHGLTLLTPEESALLAIRDGFANFEDMLTFWRGRLPFFGYIIHWRPITAMVSCGKKPLTAKTRRALQDVVEAAYVHLGKRARRRK